MNKNISKRKIVKYDGEDPQYIFDIIKEDPAWIERLVSGDTRYGNYELNDAERHFCKRYIVLVDAPHERVVNRSEPAKALQVCLMVTLPLQFLLLLQYFLFCHL